MSKQWSPASDVSTDAQVLAAECIARDAMEIITECRKVFGLKRGESLTEHVKKLSGFIDTADRNLHVADRQDCLALEVDDWEAIRQCFEGYRV